MASLRISASGNYIIMPDSITLVNPSNALYNQYSSGNKTYTATTRCIAFTRGSGQTAISIVTNGTTVNLPTNLQYTTIQLNKGDKITVPGYSSWSVGLYVYGVKYPS